MLILKEELKKITNLNNNTVLKVTCIDNEVITGYFRGYTSAVNNEPDIAQLDILTKDNNYLGLLENEIASILVIK